ncbi:hypothetical protein AA14337_1239 [Acetobacter malorum DSM 14337]|uniref:Uncharacterized protein n=1 Tax=Acetobacter malorum DSM 14337 TaxID=1307910 RepID=A0ABQ0PRT6_9PROT|nr:hypothetical protein AA14337_1239 [Acetobacter malorum DSM 14337]
MRAQAELLSERYGADAGNIGGVHMAGLRVFHASNGDMQRHAGIRRAERLQSGDEGLGIVSRRWHGMALFQSAIRMDESKIDKRSADVCTKKHKDIRDCDALENTMRKECASLSLLVFRVNVSKGVCK